MVLATNCSSNCRLHTLSARLPSFITILFVRKLPPFPLARRQQIVDFQADVLVVMGDDRLHSQLEQLAKSQPQQRQPIVVKLSKSGGVITRSAPSRMAGQASRVREYFYGTNNELCPSSSVLDLTALQVHACLVLAGNMNSLPKPGRHARRSRSRRACAPS